MATAPIIAPAEEPREMSDSELASVCAQHETQSIGYFDSEIASEQAQALNYYYGLMDDVPALDGCSRVVDHSVAVMVDNALAAVLKPFVSADEVVMFNPRGPEDVKLAEQATEYVNYVIQCDNPGFLIFHDWFKDALLTKIGVVKAWWEDQSRNEQKTAQVDAMGLMQARQSEGYAGEREVGPGIFEVATNEVVADGRAIIQNVPPEEFLITPLARSLETAPYVAHRPKNYTRSDVIELVVAMGIAPEEAVAIISPLPGYAEAHNDETRTQARYRDEERWGQGEGSSSDKSRDILGIIDEYVRVDFDGDGVSELRRVVRVDEVILYNEPVDEAPFALLCPCPMPHKVYGRSTADQSIEGQRVSTAILRQTLDNLYKTNNPRPIVGDRALNDATMDDIGDSSPGAIIRCADASQLDWAVVPFSAAQSFPMLEYIARGTEERTGIQRKGNGLNAEALEKNSPDTATQAAIDENSRNERAEMIARIFAETGVKRLFKLVLGLLVKNQPKARMIRLRNQWVEMDPGGYGGGQGWSTEMDVSISVGLGVGNKAEQIAQAEAVLTTMERLGVTEFAYLLEPKHVHAAVQRLYTAAGIKNVDDYIADPEQAQKPEPQPDPEMAKAQAQMQADQAKAQMQMQIEAAKLKAKQESDVANYQLEHQKAAASVQIEQAKAQAAAAIQASKLQLEQAKADFQARLALQESQQQFELERVKLMMARENNAENAAIKRDSAMGKERPGGDLDK